MRCFVTYLDVDRPFVFVIILNYVSYCKDFLSFLFSCMFNIMFIKYIGLYSIQ